MYTAWRLGSRSKPPHRYAHGMIDVGSIAGPHAHDHQRAGLTETPARQSVSELRCFRTVWDEVALRRRWSVLGSVSIPQRSERKKAGGNVPPAFFIRCFDTACLRGVIQHHRLASARLGTRTARVVDGNVVVSRRTSQAQLSLALSRPKNRGDVKINSPCVVGPSRDRRGRGPAVRACPAPARRSNPLPRMSRDCRPYCQAESP